jgi:hypothetical protein
VIDRWATRVGWLVVLLAALYFAGHVAVAVIR